MSHTPGPWRIDLNKYDQEYRVYEQDGAPIINSLFNPAGEIGEANARLIAAAPDLLELAIAFVSYIEDDSKSVRRQNECLFQARAAISKAIGQ